MTEVAVGDECTASSHHYSSLTNNHDVPWTILFGDAGQFCVKFTNDTGTNVSVNTWVVDTENNGDLTSSNFSAQVAPNGGITSVWFWDFGMRADGVSPRTEAQLHITVHNDDSASTGVEIWHSVHY
jgi:hypothetical protein